MKKVLIIIGVVVISATLVLSLGGCAEKIAASLVEKAIEGVAAKSGEDIDINLEDGEISMVDEEGNEVNLGGTMVPDGWPSAVPVNDNVTIAFSGASKTDGKSNWNISGTYSGTGEELYNWYKSELAAMTADSDSVFEADGEKTYTLQTSDAQYVVTIWITENESEVSTVINVSEK